MFNINKLARSLLGEESEVVLKDIGKAIKPAAKLGGHIGKDYLKQEAKEWWESQQSQGEQSQNRPQILNNRYQYLENGSVWQNGRQVGWRCPDGTIRDVQGRGIVVDRWQS